MVNRTTASNKAIREIGEILAEGYLRLLKRRSDKPQHHKQVQRAELQQIQDRKPCYRGTEEP